MRAMVLQQAKQPLQLRDVPKPKRGRGQLLVRVSTCAVCHVKVSAANRAGADAHEQLSPTPLRLRHIAQLQRLFRLLENHGAHATSINDEPRITNAELMTELE